MRITNKKHAFTAALQAGAARDFTLFKSRRQFKREASDKKSYKPGSIGPSVVASSIKNTFGDILSRRERKHWAKTYCQPLKKFYAQV